MIDTGTPRSVVGNLISSMLSTAILQNEQTSKKRSSRLKKVVKTVLKSGAAGASSIAAANYIGKTQYANALYSIIAGVSSIYATNKIFQIKEKKMGKKKDKKEKKANKKSVLDTNFGFKGGDFIVGAAIGAAAAYILTNKQASDALLKALAKGTNFFQAAYEEMKERFEDAKAEALDNA
jgi:hypothetical protein